MPSPKARAVTNMMAPHPPIALAGSRVMMKKAMTNAGVVRRTIPARTVKMVRSAFIVLPLS